MVSHHQPAVMSRLVRRSGMKSIIHFHYCHILIINIFVLQTKWIKVCAQQLSRNPLWYCLVDSIILQFTPVTEQGWRTPVWQHAPGQGRQGVLCQYSFTFYNFKLYESCAFTIYCYFESFKLKPIISCYVLQHLTWPTARSSMLAATCVSGQWLGANVGRGHCTQW